MMTDSSRATPGDTKPLYYVAKVHKRALPPHDQNGAYPAIFKRPVHKKIDGGESVSMGFPVCVPTEMMDAENLCAFMNEADPAEPIAQAPDLLARVAELEKALRTAIDHIEHMSAWITRTNIGLHSGGVYSFEGIGEDMPSLRAALAKEPRA